jgi:hypothetical protein
MPRKVVPDTLSWEAWKVHFSGSDSEIRGSQNEHLFGQIDLSENGQKDANSDLGFEGVFYQKSEVNFMQVADLAPSFWGEKKRPKRSPNRASKMRKPESQPEQLFEPGRGSLAEKSFMLLQVQKKSEELDPDPLRFRVYNSLKIGSVGGCSGPKKSCLGLRNLV